MVVVVAEVDSDRGRHEVLVAYFRWARTLTGGPAGQSPVIRGAMLNDVACMRSRGALTSEPDEEPEFAAWSLVVVLGGSPAEIWKRGRSLAGELRRCGQGRITTVATPLPSPTALKRLPPVLRYLPATDLVTAWLRGDDAWSKASIPLYAGSGACPALRLHEIGGARVSPWSDCLSVRADKRTMSPAVSNGSADRPAGDSPVGDVPVVLPIQPRSLWRMYHRSADGSAAGRDPSAALLDACRPSFEARGVELAWVTPLGCLPPFDRIELVGTARVDTAAMEPVERAFQDADAVATNLDYQAVRPEPQRLPHEPRSRFASQVRQAAR